jgi:hypothetical protein
MFHPVGPQPPSVYWRRRLLLLGSIGLLVILMTITIKIATSDGTEPAAAGAGRPRTTPALTTPVLTTPVMSSSHSSSPPTRPRTTATASASSSVAAPPCESNNLTVAAVSTKSTYHVGDQPVLELQVTNTGPAPCVQDLADKQVELKVYNGESRVWGSHDCQIQPGTNDRTLAVDTPVRVAITWSGLSSQPNCAGTRQRVGAGTYTLYAVLSGKTGRATQFTIS